MSPAGIDSPDLTMLRVTCLQGGAWVRALLQSRARKRRGSTRAALLLLSSMRGSLTGSKRKRGGPKLVVNGGTSPGAAVNVCGNLQQQEGI